jgi:hypothetical protein
MMKKTGKLLILLLVSLSTYALDVYEDIANAIRSGDAKQVAVYFGPTIELSILNQEDLYSRAQAEIVLRDFFSRNAPKSFTILHKGSSPEGTQYAIGNLVTASGKTYRTSFYIKNTGGKYLLQEFRIESE